MNLHYLYLVSFLIIILPSFIILFYLGHKRLSKYWHVPLYVGGIGFIFAASEGIAFNWQLWADNEKYILPYRFLNAQIETYLLNFLLFTAIACSTVIMVKRKPRPLYTRRR